jgi:hypothetical protein
MPHRGVLGTPGILPLSALRHRLLNLVYAAVIHTHIRKLTTSKADAAHRTRHLAIPACHGAGPCLLAGSA